MDEKLEKALECCSRVNCCACPKLKDVNCMSNLYAEVKRYIDDLEERLAIMQESMETLEKRCNALDALEQRCKALEKRNEPIKPEMIMTTGAGIGLSHCPKCGESIDEYHHPSFCGNCGQAVKWE